MPVSSDKGKQTWGLEVPYHWRDYSAWRLISELSRRHPGRFHVTECPYNEGIPTPVWYLTEDDGSAYGLKKVLINSDASVTIWDHNPACPKGDDMFDHRFATLDIMFAQDFKKIILEIEACAGLTSPKQAPATDSRTIGARFLAETLGLSMHTKKHLFVEGFLFDGSFARNHLVPWFRFLKDAGLDNLAFDEILGGWGELFIIHESASSSMYQPDLDRPLMAVNLATGKAYSWSREFDLMDRYADSGRDITRMAFDLVADAKSETKGVNNGSI